MKDFNMSDRMICTFATINYNSKTPTIATCGFHIQSMDLFLSKVKLIKKPNGAVFFAPPSEQYTDPKTGEKKWTNFFWFGDTSADFFQNEARKAFDAFCEKKNLENPITKVTRFVQDGK